MMFPNYLKTYFLALLGLLTLHQAYGQFGPGGVGDSGEVVLWLHNEGLNNLNALNPVWADISGYGNNGTTLPISVPIIMANRFGNKPGAEFTGTQTMTVADALELNFSDDLSFAVVIGNQALPIDKRFVFSKGAGVTNDAGYALDAESTQVYTRLSDGTDEFYDGTTYPGLSDPSFSIINYFQSDDRFTINTGEGSPVEFQYGDQLNALNTPQDLIIGGGPSPSILTNWIGFMGEIIIFERSLNEAEEIILENYLHATFNIPSARSLYAHFANYNYDVAGIGRVNGSNEHKDSKGLAIVRIDNPSNLDDNEFLLWAHDNEKVISGGTNENIWRFHETGDVGTVDVKMYAAGYNFVDGTEFSLFVDNNVNFTTATEFTATQWDPVLEILTFEDVSFGPNDYFTFGASVVSGPPIIDDCPLNITSTNDAGDCGASVGWVPPVSNGTLTSTHNPGEVFPVGTTTVIYTATNVEGSTTCSFTVTVTDDEDPVINNCPANISASADAGCNQLVSWTPPTASDNCNVVLSSSHNPGDSFALGTTTVTYTATDDSGNSVTCSFDVTVNDTTDPQISNCSPTVTISDFQPATQDAAATWTVPTASDNCKVMLFEASHNPGERFPVGATQVTYTAQDDAGNSTSCSFEVVVTAVNTAPTIDPLALTVNAGETESICLNVADPEGQNVALESVSASGVLGTISNIDADALCFDYTAPEEWEGLEQVEVSVCDDGDPSQCTTSTIEINVEIVWELGISQVLTPNGDGINDTWFIENIDKYPVNRVLIFDRWGSRIYKTENYNNNTVCWNGNRASDRANDRSAPSGTYFYQIELSDGRKFKGFIELVGK